MKFEKYYNFYKKWGLLYSLKKIYYKLINDNNFSGFKSYSFEVSPIVLNNILYFLSKHKLNDTDLIIAPTIYKKILSKKLKFKSFLMESGQYVLIRQS